jgi:hypothetical protein
MKKLIVFTDSAAVKKSFTAIESSRSWEFATFSHCELRRLMKEERNADLFLLDYASCKEDERQKNLNYVLRKTNSPLGIIDRKNEITDPAGILMKGTDYISGSLLKEGIKPDRLNRSTDFFEMWNGLDRNSSSPGLQTKETSQDEEIEYIIAENGWKSIKSGHDYSFIMLFTEISIPTGWKKKSGSVHLNQLKETFHSVVERETASYDGRVWIWNEYGGLVLFPFDGKSTDAVIPAVKLLLNRVLISVEDFKLHTPINLRSAMHLGTTKYKTRGKTGTIISDSINSIFHLGTKFTPLDDLDITRDVYKLMPERVKELFLETGNYEGRDIFRLRHFEVKG